MRPGIDPKVDYAFKRVFGSEGNRDVLIDLLNAVLQFAPGHEIVDVEILNPFNDKEFATDKLSIVDVKARDAAGRLFAVEMQMLARADHRQRILYYATRLYSQQIVEGDDYADMRPAYLISFVDSQVIADSPAFHTRFVLGDQSNNLIFTDDFAVHMIELPKFLTATSELGGRLDAWCYFLRNAEILDADVLPKPLSVPPIRKAMETLTVISEIERERELYESRWKRKLDDQSERAERLRYAKGIHAQWLEMAESCRKQANTLQERAQQVSSPELRDELLRLHNEALSEQAKLVRAAEHHLLVIRIFQTMRDRNQPFESFDRLVSRPLEELRSMAISLGVDTAPGDP